MTIDSIRADIARLEAERDALRDRKTWPYESAHHDEHHDREDALTAERDSLKAKLAYGEELALARDAHELAMRDERDFLKAKLVEALLERDLYCEGSLNLDRHYTERLRQIEAERDAAVQRAEAAEAHYEALNERYRARCAFAAQEVADTEQRVVEKIAEWLECPATIELHSHECADCADALESVSSSIRAGAYRKQGARDA